MKSVLNLACSDARRLGWGVVVVLGLHFPGTQAMQSQVDASGVTHYVMQTSKHRGMAQLPAVKSKAMALPSSASRVMPQRLGSLAPANGVRFVASTEPDLRSTTGARSVPTAAASEATSAAAPVPKLASMGTTQDAVFKTGDAGGTEFAASLLTAPWPNVGGGLSSGAQARAVTYWPLMLKAASQFNLDPLLIRSVIQAESAFNPLALSPKGAMGLMQLMPATARRMGVPDGRTDASEEWRVASVAALLQQPEVNIQAGSKYLAYLMQLFEGNTELAVAAYNAGEGAVQRAGRRIPPYPETQAYVRKVLALYAKAKEQSVPVTPELGAAPVSLGVSGPT
jgi:soluble lytic murein transglycosylase-like protein